MFAKTCRQNLLTLISAFAKATGSTASAVGRRFYGSGDFIEQYRRGARSISIDRYDDMIAAIRAEWPPDAKWPLLRAIVIPRPKKLVKLSRGGVANSANRLPSGDAR